MANKVNFQYIGYLGDFLAIYHDIDILSQEFECAKKNYDTASEKLSEYQNRFSFPNCLVAGAFLFAILCALQIPLIVWAKVDFRFALVFCAIISCVIIFMNKILYEKKVLPKHRADLQDEITRAKASYEKSYNELVTQRSNLHEMLEGLDDQCTYPLPIYIMREAAKEGACVNIPQGVKYFNNRYKTLSEQDDDASRNLKDKIDSERDASERKKEFLNQLDEQARTLFEK